MQRKRQSLRGVEDVEDGNDFLNSYADLMGSATDLAMESGHVPPPESPATEFSHGYEVMQSEYTFLPDREPSSIETDDEELNESRMSLSSRKSEASSALSEMSRDNLVEYAERLTGLVTSYVNRQRRSTLKASDIEAIMQRPTSELSMTHSVMSMARPSVKESTGVSRTQDEEGYKQINEYSVIAELGKGAFGKVKLAINNTTGQTVAMKIMKKAIVKNNNSEMVVRREIAVMKKIRHRNLVPLYEVLDDPVKDKMYMVMQYVENGPLVTVRPDMTCTTIPKDRAMDYLRQIANRLQYLHKHNIIHRDIKPDNMLVGKDGIIYICDFGVSEFVAKGDNAKIKGMEGTPIFLAPELINGGKAAGAPIDVWALGVSFYLAVFGVAPFAGSTWQEISKSIQTDEVKFPKSASSAWKSVFRGLLHRDPVKRMTLRALKRHRLFDDDDDDDNQNSEVEIDDDDVMASMRVLDQPVTKKYFKPSARVASQMSLFATRIRDTVKAKAEERPEEAELMFVDSGEEVSPTAQDVPGIKEREASPRGPKEERRSKRRDSSLGSKAQDPQQPTPRVNMLATNGPLTMSMRKQPAVPPLRRGSNSSVALKGNRSQQARVSARPSAHPPNLAPLTGDRRPSMDAPSPTAVTARTARGPRAAIQAASARREAPSSGQAPSLPALTPGKM
jgi:serine/threonine protein kinase